MSSVPASTFGWFATMPIARPSRRANPITTFIAQKGKTSKKSPSSTTRRITSCMSYGSRAESGIRCVSPSSIRCGVVRRRERGRVLEVVRRQVRQEVADHRQALLLVLADERGDARPARVRHRAAELLERDLLAGDRLDHVRAR